MTKSIIILTIIVSALMLAACHESNSIHDKSIEDDMTTTTEVINDEKDLKGMTPVEILNKYLNEDQLKDEKSVYWNGASAEIKVNENDKDRTGMDDGQIIEAVEHYRAKELISFRYPVGYELNVIDDRSDKCHLVGDDTEIFISPIDYEEEVKKIDEDENYVVTESLVISEDRLETYKNYKTYVGIKEINDTKKGGFVLLFENGSENAHRSYRVEVYGIGNMDYVKVVAGTVINHFRVLLPGPVSANKSIM